MTVSYFFSRLYEVGLLTAVKQEGNYETGQVCHAMINECQKYIRAYKK